MKKIIQIVLLLFASFGLQAQSNLDSLYGLWENDKLHDSIRVEAYKNYIWNGFLFSKPDSAFVLAGDLIAYSEDKGYLKGKAKGLNVQGVSRHIMGNYSQALEYYEQALAVYKEAGDKVGISEITINIGNFYYSQGDMANALEKYEEGKILFEGLNDQPGVASSLTNMGSVYKNQGDLQKALDSYERSLVISEQIANRRGIANSLGNIGDIHQKRGEYLLAIKNFTRALKIRGEINDKLGSAGTLITLGLIYQDQGNNTKALEYYRQALKVSEEIGGKPGMAQSITSIGFIYHKQGEYDKALEHFERAQKLNLEIGSKTGIASSNHNIGTVYRRLNKYEEALDYLERSLKTNEELGNKQGIASDYNNIGNIYMDQGNYSRALEYFEKSLIINQEIGDKRLLAVNLNNLGDIHKKKGDNPKALEFYKKALAISEEIVALGEQKDAYEGLYDSYKAMGNGTQALVYLEKMQVIDDSLNSEETSKKLQQMEFANQVLQDSIATAEKERLVEEAHADEMRQETKTRNVIIGIGVLILILAGGLFSRLRYVRKSKATLQVEKDRSESLLLNILPEEIAQELKEKGKADARDFDTVSILFTDFKEFTKQSAELSAADLVNEINFCFEGFDGIMEKYGIEKIKTIGDAYMAAGGLPVPTEESVKNTVLAGLEMQAFITQRKAENDAQGKPAFEMRLGIHTGPVVAGIVGVKKFQYDIWGDTVNTASRIESNGKVGKVNISQATLEFLKDDPQFSFEQRGKIEAKGKGEMEMYFVSIK